MGKWMLWTALLSLGCVRRPEFERRFDQASADIPPAILHGEGVTAAMGGNVRASTGGGRDRALPSKNESFAEITRVVQDKLPVVKHCYQRAVQEGGAQSGKAILNLSIAANGKVVDVRVDAPDYESSGLPACVSSRARAWTFPPASAARSISYPFVFMAG